MAKTLSSCCLSANKQSSGDVSYSCGYLVSSSELPGAQSLQNVSDASAYMSGPVKAALDAAIAAAYSEVEAAVKAANGIS